ncbi:MAG: hypothetical protein AABY32_02175 [Nanoarchaeota archaeon]
MSLKIKVYDEVNESTNIYEENIDDEELEMEKEIYEGNDFDHYIRDVKLKVNYLPNYKEDDSHYISLFYINLTKNGRCPNWLKGVDENNVWVEVKRTGVENKIIDKEKKNIIINILSWIGEKLSAKK